MINRLIALAGIVLVAAAAACAGYAFGQTEARAENVVYPTKISKAQIAGRIFEDYSPVITQHGDEESYDVEAFLSADRHFDAGVYRAGKSRFDIREPYGVDEYMHFIEGGVTLTSADGTVTDIGAGDSVVIPKDWTGIWETDGYQKIYVIYSPDAPIE